MSFPSVAFLISSTDTPGACSSSLKPPSDNTSSTANSVTIFLTQRIPVSGREHFLRSFEAPSLFTCCMATMIFLAEATKSMAPPIPFTILPGIFQLAMSPFSDTSIAPKMVRSIITPRIMAKLSAELNKAEPLSMEMVCLPALMRSASTSSSLGKGPMPSRPFSDCNTTFIPSGI